MHGAPSATARQRAPDSTGVRAPIVQSTAVSRGKWFVHDASEAAAKFVAMQNPCLASQCGFSSTHHGSNLTVEQQQAKLKLCIDTARELWGTP